MKKELLILGIFLGLTLLVSLGFDSSSYSPDTLQYQQAQAYIYLLSENASLVKLSIILIIPFLTTNWVKSGGMERALLDGVSRSQLLGLMHTRALKLVAVETLVIMAVSIIDAAIRGFSILDIQDQSFWYATISRWLTYAISFHFAHSISIFLAIALKPKHTVYAYFSMVVLVIALFKLSLLPDSITKYVVAFTPAYPSTLIVINQHYHAFFLGIPALIYFLLQFLLLKHKSFHRS